MSGRDEFYVGYVDRAPAGLARFVRRTVILLAVALVYAMVMLASTQRPLPTGVFEFGVVRDFEGVLYERPLPLLHVEGPDGGSTSYLLVGLGKAGLPEVTRGKHGTRVSFRGSLVHREGTAMIEMNDLESFEMLDETVSGAAPSSARLGHVELEGELVDTKCWLGVMRPATGKVHRACAARCLAGGVPPGLLVRNENGTTLVVLAGSGDEPLEFDTEWAARRIRAAGTLELHEETPVLRTENLTLVGP